MPINLALYLTPSPLNLAKRDSSVFSGPGSREKLFVCWCLGFVGVFVCLFLLGFVCLFF